MQSELTNLTSTAPGRQDNAVMVNEDDHESIGVAVKIDESKLQLFKREMTSTALPVENNGRKTRR